MMTLARTLLQVFLLGLPLAALAKQSTIKARYDGYKLYQIVPETDDQLNYLQYLWLNDTELSVDFWRDPGKVLKSVDVMVRPSSDEIFLRELDARHMNYSILMDDVQNAIETEREAIKFEGTYLRDDADTIRRSLGYKGFKLNQYHRYRAITALMESIARDNPTLAEVITLTDDDGREAKTHEGRSIQMIKIGKAKPNGQRKPAFWIDGGIHAREWIAVSVPLYIINELITEYHKDERIRQYVDEIDWYIHPVVNPDGYEWSRTTDRMWRKNRNTNGGEQWRWCWGVDLNRNFDWAFGGAGASSDKCKETYMGERTFSEPESRAMRNQIEKIKSDLLGYVTLHSYSQIWMYPYGHAKRTKSHDWQDLERVAKSGANRLKSFYGTNYQVDTGANALYPASGGSDDWAKGKMGIKYVYLIELRPEDNARAAIHGFLLPPSQIVPTCIETWAGLQVVADSILQLKGVKVTGVTTTPRIQTTTGNPNCKDAFDHCDWFGRLGWCYSKTQEMIKSCPYTCDLCSEVPPSSFDKQGGTDDGSTICEDTRSDCAYYASLKRCHWVATSCRKTCDECGGKSQVTTKKPKPSCRDERPDCAYYLKLNRCSWVETYCDKTCSKCTDDFGPTRVCEDKESFCGWWASLGACQSWRTDMLTRCPKSCQFCDASSPHPTAFTLPHSTFPQQRADVVQTTPQGYEVYSTFPNNGPPPQFPNNGGQQTGNNNGQHFGSGTRQFFTTPTPCVDHRQDCVYWQQNALCSWVDEVCARTCGTC